MYMLRCLGGRRFGVLFLEICWHGGLDGRQGKARQGKLMWWIMQCIDKASILVKLYVAMMKVWYITCMSKRFAIYR